MAVSDYSTTPDNNITIGGTNIAEMCAAGNLNNAIRQMMADVRVMYNGLPDISAYVTKTGGVFSGTQPKYTGEGAFFHWADPALISGKCYVQAAGGTAPTMAEGDLLFEYVA